MPTTAITWSLSWTCSRHQARAVAPLLFEPSALTMILMATTSFRHIVTRYVCDPSRASDLADAEAGQPAWLRPVRGEAPGGGPAACRCGCRCRRAGRRRRRGRARRRSSRSAASAVSTVSSGATRDHVAADVVPRASGRRRRPGEQVGAGDDADAPAARRRRAGRRCGGRDEPPAASRDVASAAASVTGGRHDARGRASCASTSGAVVARHAEAAPGELLGHQAVAQQRAGRRGRRGPWPA